LLSLQGLWQLLKLRLEQLSKLLPQLQPLQLQPCLVLQSVVQEQPRVLQGQGQVLLREQWQGEVLLPQVLKVSLVELVEVLVQGHGQRVVVWVMLRVAGWVRDLPGPGPASGH
jgi:hypothetical protein